MDEGKRRLRVFTLGILFPVFAALLLASLIARTDWFAAGDHEQWVRVLDFPYKLAGADADIVIFGDSAALNGVDPRLVEQSTGLRSVVLPDNLHSMTVTVDQPLASYLAHNKRPRILVLYLTPWNTGKLPSTVWPEGMVMMLRHESASMVMRQIATRPVAMLNGDINLVQMVAQRIAHHRVDSPLVAELSASRGFLPAEENGAAWPQPCQLAVDHVAPAEAGAFAEEMLTRWGKAADKVLLYLAPIPDCAGAKAFHDLQLRGVAVPAPAVLPADAFVNDDFQVHVRAARVGLSTGLLVRAVQSALSSQRE